MKMKILFNIFLMIGGGSERVLVNLANRFAEAGYEVVFVAYSVEKSYKIDKRIKFINFNIPPKNGILKYRQYFKWVPRLREVIKTELPNVIITFVNVSTLTTCLASIGLQVKTINSQRNAVSTEYHNPLKAFVAKYLIYTRFDGTVFQTKNAQAFFTKKVRDHSVIIPNLSEERFFSIKRDGERKGIVGVGRLATPKNWFCAIKAYSLIANEIPDNFTIYGAGSELNDVSEELKAYVKELGLEDRVIFAGRVDNVEEKIVNAKLFVMSSDTEGSPNSLIEGLVMGLPCVTTDFDGGGAGELIENEVNGIIVAKGDSEALAKAMHRILTDDEHAETLSRNALLSGERFRPKAVFKQWEKYVLSVIGGN